MKIKLPYVSEINTYIPPTNLKEIVWKSFKNFTKGTDKKYQHHDKLLYIDNFRRTINGYTSTEESIVKFIGNYVIYSLEDDGSVPDAEEIRSNETMRMIYDDGFMPLYKPGMFAEITTKTISEIVKFVMIYEETENDQ